MANQDSFINEVTEEVRRDRLFTLFRRYAWIGITIVVLTVAGAAWNEWRKADARAEAQARGDAILAAVEAEDPRARLAALESLRIDAPADAVISLLTATQAIEADGEPAAYEDLVALTTDATVPQIYRDLAALKAAMIGAGEVPPAERIAMLEPLTSPGHTFRPLALEQTALAHVEAGDRDAALEILTGLAGDADASEGLLRRTLQLIVALGGSVDAS